MRSVTKTLICVWAVAGLGATVRATVSEVAPGQYQAIPERNVFGLHPPLAQPAVTNPPAALPKIILTGITTILENKRALMKVLPAGPKPGETNKEQLLNLTEGQREGEVEVLQIDEHAGSVKVNNSGTVMILTFENDGAKLPVTPALPALPGLPSALPGAVTPTNPYLPAANARKMPTRSFRSPGFGAAAVSMPGVTSGAPPAGGIPSPTGLSPAPGQTQVPADQNLTAEEQAIINAFQRQENTTNPNTTNPIFPPLPATTIAPNGSPSQGTVSPGPGAPALVPQ